MKNMKVFFSKDSIICIPYLKITYRNNSTTPFYLLKLSQNNLEMPYLPSSSLSISHKRNIGSAKTFNNYSMEDSFRVEIGSKFHYLNNWEVVSDTCNWESEHEIHVINDELRSIYEIITHKRKRKSDLKNKEVKTFFDLQDITEEGILTQVNDRFVFLKSGEYYEDSYNLVGFYLLGGTYKFIFSQKEFRGYVFAEPTWENQSQKWVFSKINLPENVGQYKLFSGKFLTNEIILKCTSDK
jgi:hypothetical protein